jgi:hypothetical protein
MVLLSCPSFLAKLHYSGALFQVNSTVAEPPVKSIAAGCAEGIFPAEWSMKTVRA